MTAGHATCGKLQHSPVHCKSKVCWAGNPVLPHHGTIMITILMIVILAAAAVTLLGTAVDIIMAECMSGALASVCHS